VPCRWSGLDLAVRVGATTVSIVGRDGRQITHPRMRFGQRPIHYRHYLPELARKPQALRQVLRKLLRDLGAPFPAIWEQLHPAHGPREAARVFAKIIGQLEAHGAAVVVPAPSGPARPISPSPWGLRPPNRSVAYSLRRRRIWCGNCWRHVT